LRDDLTGTFPDHVPFLSIFSRQDEVVPWEASLDPAARYREICTTHRGLITSPVAFQLLAQELTLLATKMRIPTTSYLPRPIPLINGATHLASASVDTIMQPYREVSGSKDYSPFADLDTLSKAPRGPGSSELIERTAGLL
jgi:hypothetical protein